MTDADIKKNLREAKDPRKQVHILHELTLISKNHIKEIYNELFPDKPFAIKTPKKKKVYWTQDEVMILHDMWNHGATWDDISELLGKTKISVISKFYRYDWKHEKHLAKRT